MTNSTYNRRGNSAVIGASFDDVPMMEFRSVQRADCERRTH